MVTFLVDESPQRQFPRETVARRRLHRVVGEAVVSKEFRQLALKNPDGAARSLGIVLTPWELSILFSLLKELGE